MRLLCDEHVPPAVANALAAEGHTVRTVASDIGVGASDTDVLAFADDEGLVVLTNDSDFVGREGHRDLLYYEDQSTARREPVRTVRVVDDTLPTDALADRTVFLPDDW